MLLLTFSKRGNHRPYMPDPFCLSVSYSIHRHLVCRRKQVQAMELAQTRPYFFQINRHCCFSILMTNFVPCEFTLSWRENCLACDDKDRAENNAFLHVLKAQQTSFIRKNEEWVKATVRYDGTRNSKECHARVSNNKQPPNMLSDI